MICHQISSMLNESDLSYFCICQFFAERVKSRLLKGIHPHLSLYEIPDEQTLHGKPFKITYSSSQWLTARRLNIR